MKQFISFLKIRKNEIIALVFTSLGLFTRFHMRHKLIFSSDEIYQIKRCSVSLQDFISISHKWDVCGYLNLDFILTFISLKIFGMHKWGLALPHIIITILGFYILYRICKEYFKTSLAFFVTFSIFCFNFTLIRHAFEIRFYPVLPTLALATFYFIPSLFTDGKSFSALKKSGYVFLFVFTVLFQPLGIYILFFASLYWLIIQIINKKSFPDLFKNSGSVYIISLLISLPIWIYSIFFIKEWGPVPFDVFQYIPNPLDDQIGFLKAIFGNLIGKKFLYPFLLGLAACILPQKDRLKQVIFFITLIVLPIYLVLLGALYRDYWFLQRHFIWVMPWFAIFLGWCWESILLKVTSTAESNS